MRSKTSLGGSPAEPISQCRLAIFGAGGDVTTRLLAPALHNSCANGLLPDSEQALSTALEPLRQARDRGEGAVEACAAGSDGSSAAAALLKRDGRRRFRSSMRARADRPAASPRRSPVSR